MDFIPVIMAKFINVDRFVFTGVLMFLVSSSVAISRFSGVAVWAMPVPARHVLATARVDGYALFPQPTLNSSKGSMLDIMNARYDELICTTATTVVAAHLHNCIPY